MNILRGLLHWILEPVHHRHYYRYEAFRDDRGNYNFRWSCVSLLCGDEIADDFDD